MNITAARNAAIAYTTAAIAAVATPTADQRCRIAEIREALRRGSFSTAQRLAAQL